MYMLPLPEIVIDDVEGIVEFAKSKPDEKWFLQPARRPEESGKTMWLRQGPGDPIHDMMANQFAIPYSHFEERKVDVHLYRLIQGQELYNHKDRSRIAILFCSLDNYEDTTLTFNRSGDDGYEGRPMVKMPYTDCPLLVDGYEWHSVRNNSNQDRISISLSFHQPYTFDLLEDMYKSRELLTCQSLDSYRFPGGRQFWSDGPIPDPRYAKP